MEISDRGAPTGGQRPADSLVSDNQNRFDCGVGLGLPLAQKLLYEELERLSRLKGYAWITNSALAEKYGVCRMTVIRWIQKLESQGLLVVQRSRRERRIFVPLTQEVVFDLPRESQNVTQDVTPGVTECYSESHKMLLSRVTECDPNINITMNEKEREEIQRIFDAWRTVLDHPQSKLDEKRTKIIAQRLKEFSADELCRVFEGAKRSPFHMGQNDRARKYDDIRILFRDAEQVEKFLELANPPSTVLNKPPVLDEYDQLRLKHIGKDRKYR